MGHNCTHTHPPMGCQGHQYCGHNVTVSWFSLQTFPLFLYLSLLPSFFPALIPLLFPATPSSRPLCMTLLLTYSKPLRIKGEWASVTGLSCMFQQRPARAGAETGGVISLHLSLFLPPAGLSFSLLFCHTLSLSHPFLSSVALLSSCLTIHCHTSQPSRSHTVQFLSLSLFKHFLIFY